MEPTKNLAKWWGPHSILLPYSLTHTHTHSLLYPNSFFDPGAVKGLGWGGEYWGLRAAP